MPTSPATVNGMVDPPGRLPRLINTAVVVARAAVERSVPFWSAERIEWLQRRRLRAIVRHAYQTVPFYTRAMDELGLRPGDFREVTDLARLPLLDASQVRRDLSAFLSAKYVSRARYVLESSGSSSHVRTRVYWDGAAILRRLAHTARDRAVLDRLAGCGPGQRHLYVLPPNGASLRLRAWWDALTVRPGGRAECIVFAPDESLDLAVECLRTVRPHVVFSFGSWAHLFFRFVGERGLEIPVPRVWVYGGDGLGPDGRALIEGKYGCPTYSTYQSVETGRLGFQCEERAAFHLNVDLCAVRVVDARGRPVAPGEEGEVIVSNLHNRAMVLLNYRLGDRAVLARQPCPCGRSLPGIESLAGRTTEIIRLGGDRDVSSLALQNLFRPELEAMLQVQIVQHRTRQLTWRLVPLAHADRAAIARALIERGREVLGRDVEIDVEFVEHIPAASGGKVRSVVSTMAQTDHP